MPEIVRFLEGLRHFLELPGAVVGSEVDRRADTRCAEVERLASGAEHHLVGLVGVGQELVVVDLDDERDAVGVLAADSAEHAEGGRDGVAATLDRQLDDVGRIEVQRVRGERRRRQSARCPDRPAGSTGIRCWPSGRGRTAGRDCAARPAADRTLPVSDQENLGLRASTDRGSHRHTHGSTASRHRRRAEWTRPRDSSRSVHDPSRVGTTTGRSSALIVSADGARPDREWTAYAAPERG